MDISGCLVNKYRDGDDSIRAHRDTYVVFGEHPIIIGISIGDSRILRVRRLHNPEIFKSLKVQKASDENIDFLWKTIRYLLWQVSVKYIFHTKYLRWKVKMDIVNFP